MAKGSAALKKTQLPQETLKLYEQYKTKAENVATEIHRFATEVEAIDFIIDFLKKEGIADKEGSYAIWAGGPLSQHLDKKSLSSKVPGLKFEVTKDSAAVSRVGITQMQWALADTGTLVQDQSDVNQRLASSLPWIHVAILSTKNILPDMFTVIEKVDPFKTKFLQFITGPSRTADIERVLTIGVHGPERMVAVFVDELEV